MNVVIVGAGLFGSVAARLCKDAGYNVVVIDDDRPGSGSKAAACLMKPSWLAALGSKHKIGLTILEKLYGLRTIHFKVSKGYTSVYWVPPYEILKNQEYSIISETVVKVENGRVITELGEYTGKVLIAAGTACRELLGVPVQPKYGQALYFRGEVTDPRISIVAPYKQLVSFNIRPDLIWCGDGTAVNEYTRFHEERHFKRAMNHGLYERDCVRRIVGARPYLGNGFFEQVYPNTWVSTGGGKSGTVLAAYQAKLFLEAIS